MEKRSLQYIACKEVKDSTVKKKMVKQQLVDYINDGVSKGYSADRLYEHLVENGVNPDEVREAVDYVKKRPPTQRYTYVPPVYPHKEEKKQQITVPKLPFWKIIIVIFLILTLSYAGYWYMTRPVCGNGKADNGETQANCCIDMGCQGEQNCESNKCVEPVCGDCQFLQNHKCMDYECCGNDSCSADDRCIDHKCEPLNCTECSHVVNHTCVDYGCCANSDCAATQTCSDHQCRELQCSSCEVAQHHFCLPYVCCSVSDCDDGVSTTADLCISSSTLSARCVNIPESKCQSDPDCDDKDAATADLCAGDTKECMHVGITTCRSDDGYCPVKCDYKNDNDCSNTKPVVNCFQDEKCFDQNLQSCTPANFTSRMGVDNIWVYTILGKEGNYCRIRHRLIRTSVGELSGTSYDCNIEADNLDVDTYYAWIEENMMEKCTGSYIAILSNSKCIQYSLTAGASVHEADTTIRLVKILPENIRVEVGGVAGSVNYYEAKVINSVKISYLNLDGSKALVGIMCDVS